MLNKRNKDRNFRVLLFKFTALLQGIAEEALVLTFFLSINLDII